MKLFVFASILLVIFVLNSTALPHHEHKHDGKNCTKHKANLTEHDGEHKHEDMKHELNGTHSAGHSHHHHLTNETLNYNGKLFIKFKFQKN